jgi:lysophospholipase L1-like esterase
VFFGDSITVELIGSALAGIGDRSGPNLVAAAGLVDPYFCASGGDTLNAHASTQAVANAFVQSLPADATDFWSTMGANDYISNTESAAVFQSYYANLLSALATYRPAMRVYVNSPLPETVETANGSGSTLGNYRTAAQTACAGFGSCTFVDGTSCGVTSPGDLAGDGIHPNDNGHAKWAGTCISPKLLAASSVSSVFIQGAIYDGMNYTPATEFLYNGAPLLWLGGDPGTSGTYGGFWGPLASPGASNWFLLNNGTGGDTFLNAPTTTHFRIGGASDILALTSTELAPGVTNTIALGDSTHAFKAFINGIDTDTTNTTLPIGPTNATAINIGNANATTFALTTKNANPIKLNGTQLWYPIGASVDTQQATITHVVYPFKVTASGTQMAASGSAGSVFCAPADTTYGIEVHWSGRYPTTGVPTGYAAGEISNTCFNNASASTCGTTNAVIPGNGSGGWCNTPGAPALPTFNIIAASGLCFQIQDVCPATMLGNWDGQFDIYVHIN